MAETPVIYTPRNRPVASARSFPADAPEFLLGYKKQAEEQVASRYVGITADGSAEPGLFAIQPTGIDNTASREAAAAFLAQLPAELRTQAQFDVNADAWRRWSNIHVFVMRHGVSLEGLNDAGREAGLDLLRAALSDYGFETARDIMRLNETIREITGSDDEYGEWPYWMSIFGEPSATDPWGWQIDGHHLILNCLVLGGQMVLTPMFMGSEPVHARTGKYAGTRVFGVEEERGLNFMRALTPEQQATATLGTELPGDVFTTGYRDNFEMRYEGLRFGEMTISQQNQLMELIEIYVGRITPEHAKLKMYEVRKHLAQTYFAWIGSGTGDDDVFYYRVHSPVLLIEFDHQRGVALDVNQPFKDHIHTVVRTPNGNDYGKDLLRQHYEQFDHSKPGTH
ncbi:MAG: DUF3500 domain-containing protein [Dehalococcoidia bacterium]